MNRYKKILTGAIKGYQRYISPLKGRTCRFYPTCSQYALIAVEKYGILEALGLTLKRIFRCHPFCAGGYDPVPERKKERR